MTESNESFILDKIEFKGDVSFEGQSFPITFRVWSKSDCRLIFEVDPVSTQVYLLGHGQIGEPGTKAAGCSLSGTSDDGERFYSDHVSVFAKNSGVDGKFVSISTRHAKITLPHGERQEKPVMRLWFRAFETFRNPVIETRLGRMLVEGRAGNINSDEMSGSIALQDDGDVRDVNWRNEADKFLRHMHRGLAFAHGGRLQTPRLDYISDNEWEVNFYEGTGFKHELPVLHPLDQSHFIQALVAKYEDSGPLPDLLWNAVGWMQVDTTFDEVRFLSAMTAVETIVQNQLPGRKGTVIPKADYRVLRDKLKAFVNDEKGLGEETRSILNGRIDQNNNKTLSQKVEGLFDHYDLPRQDFEGNAIRDLTKLRNDIVHFGGVPDGVDIWSQIILVRELIARVVLREIGFAGHYECYVGGYNKREFPERLKVAKDTAD